MRLLGMTPAELKAMVGGLNAYGVTVKTFLCAIAHLRIHCGGVWHFRSSKRFVESCDANCFYGTIGTLGSGRNRAALKRIAESVNKHRDGRG